jgi:DNA-directed RNA polymerase subunit K/omega
MESLLPANDLPGLNIVCTVDAGGNNGTNRTHTGGGVGKNMNIHQKMKKPKKKNKYEKRRAQARKAKQLKENSGTDKESVTKENGKEKEKGKILSVEKDKRQGDNDNDSNGPSDEVTQKTETKITHTSNDSNENNDDGDVEDNEKTENDKMELSESTSNQTATRSEIEIMKEVSNSVPETYNVPVITNTTTTQPIINMDNAASRKNQQLQTEQLLKDEVKRAEYMSTYHARPFEMDRKSGAVSKIQQSRSSSHIFGNDGNITDDESTSNSNGDGGSSSKDGCPFTSCGLHPNIVRVITSSKGSGLNLERPTTIQRHAWEQILIKKESKKDNNKSIRRRNLFVQSETGSGKTLAYLLPIVQVSLKQFSSME